jgi:hypothetical protein
MRRRGPNLLLSIENPGDLERAHIVAQLDGAFARGGHGMRLRLPADFDTRGDGTPFSVGLEGYRDGKPGLRRWAGGLPEGIFSGAAGKLMADVRS